MSFPVRALFTFIMIHGIGTPIYGKKLRGDNTDVVHGKREKDLRREEIHAANLSGDLSVHPSDKTLQKNSKSTWLETQRNLQYEPECVGDTLHPGQRLKPGEALCDDVENPTQWFGLESFGSIGVWSRGEEEYTTITYWSPGNTEDGREYEKHYLQFQTDGNLVLYKKGDTSQTDAEPVPVWATDCLVPGSRLEKNGPESLIQIVDQYGKVVWKVYENGEESDCSPQPNAEAPTPHCLSSLEPHHKLTRNQYICEDNGSDSERRFGLNSRGQLSLWNKKKAIWSAGYDKIGDELKIQLGDGNVVLRDEGGAPVWSSGCRTEKERVIKDLRFNSGDIDATMQDGTVLWSLFEHQGDPSESVCYPAKECSGGTSISGNTCRVRMIDHLNTHYTILEVVQMTNDKYIVKDGVDYSYECNREGPYEIEVTLKPNGKLDIDAGVPDVTCDQMVNSDRWRMRDDTQLTFLKDPDYPECSQFGKNLVYFMIEEWLYFG